ncbi:hypothetical protein KM043_009835 [Ampulex compressa]|nr:hypothetical protein KM043_009835 [Ampulex compressa]
METWQNLKDSEELYEEFIYSESEEWREYEDDEEDFADDFSDARPEESKILEEVDIMQDYMTKFEAKRAKELVAKTKTQTEQLRLLIGIKKKKDSDVSEETIITPEEESLPPAAESSESSTHPCFRDIEISDSQLKLTNPYTMYPIPDDPGLVPAFWIIYPREPIYKDDGVQKFYDIVKKSGIRPIRCLKEMLLSDKINLEYYGIESRAVKAICEAIENNTSIQTINLKGNWLSTDACYHLNQLLLKNNVVNTLLLSGCRIGPEGVQKMHSGLSANATLTTLDLSSCNLGNEGFSFLASGVSNSQSLESLCVHNNGLDESCAEDLRFLVSSSYALKYLDLSWNSLYTKTTWEMLLDGLERSKALTELDLSWNGLDSECVPFLCQLIIRPSTLEKLYLNDNRFREQDAIPLAKALSKNNNLKEIQLKNNPLKPQGAYTLVHALTPEKTIENNLRLLDLTNVWAKKDILPELEKISADKPWLKIKLGGVLSNYNVVGPDSRKILLRRANYEAMQPKKVKFRKNFGHFVLSLEDNSVSKGKFSELVQNYNLKLSESLINEIINVFTDGKNVDLKLLKSFYLEQYPDTKMAEKTVPKSKKIKQGKSGKSKMKGKRK